MLSFLTFIGGQTSADFFKVCMSLQSLGHNCAVTVCLVYFTSAKKLAITLDASGKFSKTTCG